MGTSNIVKNPLKRNPYLKNYSFKSFFTDLNDVIPELNEPGQYVNDVSMRNGYKMFTTPVKCS